MLQIAILTPSSRPTFHLFNLDPEKVLGKKCDSAQQVMNDSIYEINEYIHKKNIKKLQWAPDMATPVHRQIRGENSSHYNHLASDGIHISQDLRKKWAKKILSTAERY